MAYHGLCFVPGCPRDGRHSLNIRIMRPDTSAIAAPRTGAYMCDDHATQGMDIEIMCVPTTNRKLRVETYAVAEDGTQGAPAVKELPITGGATRKQEA